MNKRNLKRIGLALLLSSVAFTQIAHAQIEEVIVTAQKRAESQQDVPISIQTVTGDLLEQIGITNTDDLGVMVPGLQMAQGGIANVAFIRGLGNQDASGAQEGSVATYVDGMWFGSVTGSALTFHNIERVEVLKGPQGTLFGRNTTGGVINIITKDPSHDPVFDVSLGYGNYDTVRAGLYGSGGLSESLAADISVHYSDQGEGYGDNQATGGEVNQREDEFSLRTKWKYGSDSFSAMFSAAYEEFSDDMGYARAMPDGGSVSVNGEFAPSDRRDVFLDSEPIADFESTTFTLRLEKRFENFDLVSITGYKDDDLQSLADNDSSGAFILDADIDFGNESTTQEIQILSNDAEASLTWQAGLYYLDQSAFGYYEIIGPGAAGILGPGVTLESLRFGGDIDTESIAGYGEITWNLSDDTRLTGGLRYTDDTREISGIIAQPFAIDGNGFSKEPSSGIDLGAIPSPDQKASFDEMTYRVVLDHHLRDNLMLYASYNRGFRSGNFNTVAPADPAFAPELLDAYEVGFKSELLDRRVRFNGAAYFYDVTDLQFQVLEGVSTVIVNAAEAEIKGFEFDVLFRATDDLDLEFAAAYMDGEYTSFPTATSNVPTPTAPTNTTLVVDATGNQLAGAPELLVTGAARYTVEGDSGDYSFSLRATYNDGYPWEPDGRLEQDSYTIVNLSAGWRARSDKWGIRVNARNLLDEDYSVTTRAQAGLGDFYASGSPRTYYVTIDYSMW